jgi:serine O-acetyltransferase
MSRWSRLWSDVSLDIQRYLDEAAGRGVPRPGLATRSSVLLTPPLLSVFVYRVSHMLHDSGWRKCAEAARYLNMLLHKVDISPSSSIGAGAFVPHPAGIVFHGHAGRRLTLFSDALCTGERPFSGRADQGPRLGDDVMLSVHASVLGPVSVDSGTAIALRTDLREDAPGGCVAASRNVRVRIRPRDGSGAEGPEL